MSDDPTPLMRAVVGLADTFSVLHKAEVASAVKVLATLATEDTGEGRAAMLALQVMAQAYNYKTKETTYD